MQPEAILKKYWGFEQFRPLQKDIVLSILDGKDTLGLLATGGGKSITYQVPALMMEGICIVISPLIALMQDQMDGLKSKNIKAISLNSSLSKKQMDVALDNCIYGDYKFLFVSPERLHNPLFIERLRRMTVCMIAVDEAHCISQWGHDFRPDYLTIADIRDVHDCPMLALTATATMNVSKDIIKYLKLEKPTIIEGSFARNNLQFNSHTSHDKYADTLNLLKDKDEVAIVYTRSRAATEKIASFLNEHGITAAFYHAGLSQVVRKEIQEDWMKEKFKVMVATNAFGMGIDKPNVRQVIHFSLCDNPEAYFQEAGRAGRDQQEAQVHLLYTEEDLLKASYRVEQNHPSPEYIRKVYNNLCLNYQLAIGSGEDEEFAFDLNSFCKKYQLKLMKCHAAIKLLNNNHHVQLSDGYIKSATLQIIVDRTVVENFIQDQPKLGELLSFVLRSYTHLFTQKVNVRESELMSRTGLNYFEIKTKLTQIQEYGIINYLPSHDQAMIRFVDARVDHRHLMLDVKSIIVRKKQAINKLKAMVNYTTSLHICRPLLLLHYFGHDAKANCSKCDNCRENNSVDYDKIVSIRKSVFTRVKTSPTQLHSILDSDFGIQEDSLKSILRWMMNEGIIDLRKGVFHLQHHS